MGSNRRKGYRRRREGSLAPLFGGILVLASIGYLGFGDRILSALRPAAASPPRVEVRSAPPPKRILTAETGTLVVSISNATLTLETGSRMIVPGESPPPTRPVDVELLEGTVFTQVGYRMSDAQFTITTFNAGAGVRGTAFRVRVWKNERTEVEVVEGVVEVWNKERTGESIYLRGGESARISGASAPARDERSRDWLSRVWPVDRSVSGLLASRDRYPSAGGGGPPPSVPTPLQPGDAEAGRIIREIERIRQEVRSLLETARQSRDVVLTLCRNDKLNQLDVALRSARERFTSWRAKSGPNDVEARNYEFEQLTILGQRAQTLGTEARMCLGKESGADSSGPVVVSTASTAGGPSVESEILRTFQEGHGAGSREELLRSYRRMEGSSAEEVLRRSDLSATERRAAEAAQRAAGQPGLSGGYQRYDRRDSAALEDLYRSQGGR